MKHGVCALLHWRWGKARSLFGIVFAQDHRGFDLQKIRCEAAGRGWQQCCLDGGADPGDPGNGLRRPFVISPLKSKEQKPSQASWYKPHSTQKRCCWAALRPSLPDSPSPPSPSLMVRPWPYEIQA